MGKRRKARLRIHPNNGLLLQLPPTHPAVRALIVQAEARDVCVGREIAWPNMVEEPVDQEWFSTIDQRTWTFSGFAYAFISFDLVLDGWLNENQTLLQPFERDFLHELSRLLELLDECQSAAQADGNHRVLPLIAKARDFFCAFEYSIIARVGNVTPDLKKQPIQSLWGAGKLELA